MSPIFNVASCALLLQTVLATKSREQIKCAIGYPTSLQYQSFKTAENEKIQKIPEILELEILQIVEYPPLLAPLKMV